MQHSLKFILKERQNKISRCKALNLLLLGWFLDANIFQKTSFYRLVYQTVHITLYQNCLKLTTLLYEIEGLSVKISLSSEFTKFLFDGCSTQLLGQFWAILKIFKVQRIKSPPILGTKQLYLYKSTRIIHIFTF